MGSNEIEWELGRTRGLDPDRLYQVRGGWAPPSPVACPAGHRLGPGQALVGSTACIATPTGFHRTYTCRRCDAVVMWPPETAECDHRAFDGR